jgi:hypothetical protein
MAHVARRNESSARNGLCGFSDYHSVHANEVAGIQINQREFVLGGNTLGDRARPGSGRMAIMNGGSRRQRRERNQHIITGINLQSDFRHGKVP